MYKFEIISKIEDCRLAVGLTFYVIFEPSSSANFFPIDDELYVSISVSSHRDFYNPAGRGPRPETIQQGSRALLVQQTCRGSFSAESKSMLHMNTE